MECRTKSKRKKKDKKINRKLAKFLDFNIPSTVWGHLRTRERKKKK